MAKKLNRPVRIFEIFSYPAITSSVGFWKFSWIMFFIILAPDLIKASCPIVMNPNVTVRLANPQYNCVTNEYCLDVEFQSDISDQELFGMNVRFFYEDQVLELINFRDFQGGYGPVAPNPPQVLTSPAAFGYDYFGFGIPGNGAADWVNGAIQLVDENQTPIYISTSGWTKLFQICFTIDDPDPDSLNFCPSVVWDLEMNPADGGYLAGDDGVVMTIATGVQGESIPAFEHVDQFNWEYTGDGLAPPYGEPVEMSCISILVDATINASTEAGCYYTDRVFQPMQPELPGATYQWDFGYGAIPANASGYGPHTVYYDTMGIKTVSLVIYPAQGGAACGDSSTLMFTINTCLANIVGHINSNEDAPIPGVNVRLYPDADLDGVADNTVPVRSVFSNSVGDFSMASLTPGHYVIVESQPAGWLSVDDGDTTPDNDVVVNIDSLDNLIPVSLDPGEIDMVNYFIESALPGFITGFVFADLNGDQFPDDGEGLENVTVSLFADDNLDGITDSPTPLAVGLTSSNGEYAFMDMAVGSYVLVETQPEDYISVMDFDQSNDGDIVPNTDTQNDTLPVTLENGEVDAQNFFIDVSDCSLLVTNTNDSGAGSFRDAINCAVAGDTVKFSSALNGMTIYINSGRIVINKNIFIHSSLSPRITIASEVDGLFDITAGFTVEFKMLDIISGYAGNIGAAFNNLGTLKLQDVSVLRNPLLPPGEYLIRNGTSSQLFLTGICFLEMD
jgi:hypothetical protein